MRIKRQNYVKVYSSQSVAIKKKEHETQHRNKAGKTGLIILFDYHIKFFSLFLHHQ